MVYTKLELHNKSSCGITYIDNHHTGSGFSVIGISLVNTGKSYDAVIKFQSTSTRIDFGIYVVLNPEHYYQNFKIKFSNITIRGVTDELFATHKLYYYVRTN